MDWRTPAEFAAILDATPARQVITVLLSGRRQAVHRAAVVAFNPGLVGRPCRLLGIESDSGERYVLLDDGGYELVHLYTDRPTRDDVAVDKGVPR
jgi:hypothetical protein